MILPVDRINSELESLTRRLDFNKLPVAQVQAQFSQLSSQISQLGTQVGSTTGGFMSMTQELDIPSEVIDQTFAEMDAAAGDFDPSGSFGLQEQLGNVKGVVNRGIVMLAEDPPGIAIGNAVSAANDQLQALTEGAVAGGFNNINITANTPEAMAKVMSRVGNVPISDAQAALGNIVPQVDAFQSNISGVVNSLQNNLPVISSLSDQVSSFGKNIKETLGDVISAKGFLNDTAEKLTGAIKGDIKGLLNDALPIPDETLDFARLVVQNGAAGVASKALAKFSNLSPDELIESLSSIDTSLARNILGSTAETPVPVSGVSPTAAPANPNVPIRNASALMGLISSIDRDITEIVFDTAPVFETQPLLLAEDFPNYHFIIQTDGTIMRPAALNQKLTIPGHEDYSIGVMVALRNRRFSADQTSILNNLLRIYFTLFPQGQVFNVSDIEAAVNGSAGNVVFDFVDFAQQHFGYIPAISTPTSSVSTPQLEQRVRNNSTEANNAPPDPVPTVEQELTSEYPFVHPEDRGRVSSIWTYNYGDDARNDAILQQGPFANPSGELQKVFFRINSAGGRILVALSDTSSYEASGYTWFVYTLDEFIADGVPVGDGLISRNNIVRRPVN